MSCQQSMQAALLGTILVAEGFDYIPMWNKVKTLFKNSLRIYGRPAFLINDFQ